MKTRTILSTGITRLLFLAVLGAAPSAWSVTRGWDGDASTNDLGTAANWTGNGLPSPATPDVMQWNGAITGPLALTYTTTSFAGAAGNAGLSLDITAGQIDSVNLDSGNTNAFRMNGITITAGGGAFSMGNGAGNFNITLGGAGGQTHPWTNSSSNAATFASEVVFTLGGGGAHTLSLSGTGGWVFNNPVGQGAGTLTMTVNSNSIATFNATSTYTGPTNIGGTNMAAVVRANADNALGTGAIVFGNNSTSSRLELLGGRSLSNAITFAGRNVDSAAIESISGSNTLSGTLTVGTGGSFYKVQADAGSSLTLSNATAITSNATGARNVTLQGDGMGFVNGAIVNGTATIQLTKGGAGTWTLMGTNSYTGQTTVEGGTLRLSGANNGTGTDAVVNAGNLVLAKTNPLGANSLIRLAGNNVSTLTYATDGGDNVYALTMGTGTIATIVSDRATPGAGINHTLTTQSLANGVGGGTINFASGGNVTSDMGRITFNQLGLGSGFADAITVLNPTTANVTVGNISKQNNDLSQTIELGGTTTDNFVTGVISNGPALTGANNVSLTKSSTSTWTLTGTNTYTGATNVNGGTLVVEGTLGPGTINVAGDADLILEASQTIAALNIGEGGVVTLGATSAPAELLSAAVIDSEMLAFAGGEIPGATSFAAAPVPEPGTIALLLLAALGFIGRQRRA